MRPQEDELFARFQRTSRPELLGRVYDLVAPELLHVALHLVGRPAEAEDVLQATFLVALEKARDYDPSRPLRPWLLGILARQAQQARARSRRVPDPERLEQREPTPPEQDAEREELSRLLDQALFSLPSAYQSVLVLRLRHGLDPLDIAHALGRPPGTVRAQLSRGLERLRRLLPVSLLGGSLSALEGSSRGLEAVRAAIVAHAQAQLPWTAVILGGITMHKLAVAGSVLAIALLLPLGWKRILAPRPGPVASRPAELVPPVRASAEPIAAPMASERRALEPSVALEVEDAPALRAEAPEPTFGSLRVRVLDTALRASVPDAWVLAEVFAPGSSYSQQAWARSDAAGEAFFPELPVGHASVVLLQGRQDGVEIRPGKTATLALGLLAGFEVQGEVVDDAGHPVPRAEIWLARRWDWAQGEVVTRADAAGRFRFSGMSADHAIGARAPGWAASLLQNPGASPGESVELRLVLDTHACALEGVVRDPEGRPIARADVLCGPEAVAEKKRLADGSMAFGPPPARATSDEHGRFRLEHLEPAPALLQIRRHGYAPFAGVVDPLTTSADQAITLERGGATLCGRVVDAQGRPAGGVWVHTDSSFSGVRTWSERDGSFALAGLPLGSVEVIAEQPGVGRATLTLAVEAGGSYRWDACLAPSWAYHGRLEDAGGRPIEGWAVVARRGQQVVASSAPSDARGSFVLEVDRDEAHTLLVQAPGGWRELPRATLHGVRPSEEALTIRVGDEELGRIVATLLAADGTPATEARLTLWHDDERLYRVFDADPGDGRVVAERVPPGTVQLSILSDEHPWLQLGERVLAPGEECDLGVVRLARGWKIAGEVTGLSDELLDMLVLTVGDEQGIEASGVELHGRLWRTGALAPGRYRLLALGEGIQMASLSFDVAEGGARDVGLRLEPAGVRTALLHAPEGSELPRNVWCSLRDAEGRVVWMGGGPLQDGVLAARVSALPGRYQLVAQGGALALDAPFEILGFEDGGPPVELVLARR